MSGGALLGWGEIRDGVVGSWRILRGDPHAMRSFDVSADGFWRSFGVVVPLLLPVLVGVAAERRMHLVQLGIDASDFPTVFFAVMQIVSYLVAWFGVPLLLAAIAGPIGIAARFSPLIVARNWSSLLGIAPFTIASIGYLSGFASQQSFGFLILLSLIFNLVLGYKVTRAAALVSPAVSVGIVVVDLLFTMLVANVADRIVGL